MPLLITDGSCYCNCLAVELLSRGEIPLIDGHFSHVVKCMRQTTAISRGSIDLLRFFTGAFGFFVFTKIRQSPALRSPSASRQELGALPACFLSRTLCCVSSELIVAERGSGIRSGDIYSRVVSCLRAQSGQSGQGLQRVFSPAPSSFCVRQLQPVFEIVWEKAE